MNFDRRTLLSLAASACAGLTLAGAPAAVAQEENTVKVGLILPLTGPFAPIGREVEAGARLYMAQHGNEVAGKTIELVVQDDANAANETKRIAQEMVVNEGVDILAGFGLTPLAFAAAPIATQARVPMVVMAAGTASITEKSPYIVRTSFTLPQPASIMGTWAAENGIEEVVTLVSDYAPGTDAQDWFVKTFEEAGGTVLEQIQVPLQNPDFSPYLQRVRDLEPDAVFVFVPSGQSAQFMRQFRERGLLDAGIELIGTGDVTDDMVLNEMGDVALGVMTAHHYSAAHPSELNQTFVEEFEAANEMRPNFMAVGGYDGMALIYQALEETGGDASGDALIEAMKGMEWESPRGPVKIDPETRDIIQNVYISEVQEVDGELYNVEQQTFEAVKDPVKEAQQ